MNRYDCIVKVGNRNLKVQVWAGSEDEAKAKAQNVASAIAQRSDQNGLLRIDGNVTINFSLPR